MINMYEILYFLNVAEGKCIAVANATKFSVESGSTPRNIKFVWHSDTILIFKQGVFYAALKSRYKSTDDLAEEMKDTTLESVMTKLQHYKLSFIVDKELEVLGRFSNPYIVYKSLKEEYTLLDEETRIERLSNDEIRTAI